MASEGDPPGFSSVGLAYRVFSGATCEAAAAFSGGLVSGSAKNLPTVAHAG